MILSHHAFYQCAVAFVVARQYAQRIYVAAGVSSSLLKVACTRMGEHFAKHSNKLMLTGDHYDILHQQAKHVMCTLVGHGQRRAVLSSKMWWNIEPPCCRIVSVARGGTHIVFAQGRL